MALTPRSSRNRQRAILPLGMIVFLKRRFHQMIGFCIFLLGLSVVASLVTYNPLDPSWNLAIENPVKNILSFPGAIIADTLLQTFGAVSLFFPIVFMGWGLQLMIAIPPRWLFLRTLTLICTILFAAGAIAQFTPPKAWHLPSGLGGASGNILRHQVFQGVGHMPFASMILGGISLLMITLSMLLLLFSLGLSMRQIFVGSSKIITSIRFIIMAFFQGIVRLGSWVGTRLTSRLDEPLSFSNTSLNLASPSLDKAQESSTAIVLSAEDRELHGFSTPGEKLRIEMPETEQRSASILWKEDFSQEQEKLSSKASQKASSDYSLMPTLPEEEYALPSFDLLDSSLKRISQKIDPQALEESAVQLKTVLEEYGVRGDIETVRPGPVVTMYELKPAAGIKTSRVIGLSDDIARSMSALSTRIAVIPGRNVIGIELPNSTRETVYLRELLQSDGYEKSASRLPLILGKDIGGHSVIADLARMPHLLVAGTTGSGKSVAVNTMILSLLFRLSPDQCKFIMIDPKMLELSIYDDIPHLLSPVVTDPKKAVVALKWAVREMENRYRAMSKLGVRNIDGYNARLKEARGTGELLIRRVQTGFDPDSGKPIFENQPLDLGPLPYIVVVVDEMADLMLVAGKEIEGAVQRLAQMARAAGIHLIMATQRPSVDVITGTIKANFPTRISFQVTSKIDSRTILGEQGAEQLLGQGDMLYMAGGGRIMRVHAPLVRDDEVERVVAFLKTQGEPSYIESVTEDDDAIMEMAIEGAKDGDDALYHQAVEIVLREGKASTSFIQRHLQIGYNKAARIMESMEKKGVVSSANHAGKREILM